MRRLPLPKAIPVNLNHVESLERVRAVSGRHKGLAPVEAATHTVWLVLAAREPVAKFYRNPEQTTALCGLGSTNTVLELGCGSGHFTRALAAQCARLIASDVQERYLEPTRMQTRDVQNLEYLGADALSIPLPDASVDVVLLISTRTQIPKPVGVLLECLRVLRPGGRIVVSEEMFTPEYVPVSVLDS